MMEQSSEIETLKNLGPKSSEWLGQIGVTTQQEIIDLTPEGVYLELWQVLDGKSIGLSVNMLYGLEGVVRDIDWREIPNSRKIQLKDFAQSLKDGSIFDT